MCMSETIKSLGVVPGVVLEDAKDAKPLAKALVEGGLPCAEVTFRTAAAEESIRLMTEAYPDMLVGAGTVLTIDQVNRAVNAGAKFIVSPGFDPEIVDYCLNRGIPVFPGCVTATEVALAAPYTDISFMPTGGVNAKNLKDYLGFKRIIACGGSWMVKGDMIKAGEFDKIKAMTEEAVNLVKEIRG